MVDEAIEQGLEAIVAARGALDSLERMLVARARARGDVVRLGEPLGLSKQGARRRHLAIDPIFARRPRRPPTSTSTTLRCSRRCALSDHPRDEGSAARSMQGRLDGTCSRASRCGTIRSATRTSGRSGCTRRRATQAAQSSTCSRASRGSSRCGATGPRSGDLSRAARPRGRRHAHRLRRCLHPPSAAPGSSIRTGAAATAYLCDEIVPFVDARYDSSGFRGVAGKSSGGQGAAVTLMLRPDLFHGFASHAGGGLFEVVDPALLPRRGAAAARRLQRSIARFLANSTPGRRRSRTRTTYVLLQ